MSARFSPVAVVAAHGDNLRTVGRDAALAALLAIPIFGFWRLFVHAGGSAIDLYPTFIAGQLVLAGHAEAVYHSVSWAHGDALHPLWRELMQVHGIGRAASTFVYSPGYLCLTLPLTATLSYQRFKLVWLLICAWSVAFSGLSSSVLAGRESLRLRVLAATLATVCFAAYYGAALGQNVAPALAGLCLGYRLLAAGSASGLVPLAIALTFKPWLLLWMPTLLLLGELRRGLQLVLMSLLVQVGLPALFMPQLFRGYLGALQRLSGQSLVDLNNVSLRAFVHRSAWPEWTSYANAYAEMTLPAALYAVERVSGLVIVAGLVLVWRRRRPSREAVLVASWCWVLLPLGICWTHYLLFSMPACIWLAFGARLPSAWRLMGALGLASLLLPWQHVFRWLPPLDPSHAAELATILLSPWLVTLLMAVCALSAPERAIERRGEPCRAQTSST